LYFQHEKKKKKKVTQTMGNLKICEFKVFLFILTMVAGQSQKQGCHLAFLKQFVEINFLGLFQTFKKIVSF
jgi:hypothetical protein